MKRLFALILSVSSLAASASSEVFFDDFSYSDIEAARAAGWTPRTQAGHPGIEGASWQAAGLSFIADPAGKGNRLMRLTGRTDGTGPGTQQTQICHARKYLEGTYAARVRFRDAPLSGLDGDPVIQTFYAASPLKHDFDPEFSELDWEYLANGGWGAQATRLYSVSWQTVRIEPWLAFNQSHEELASMDGWHVLMMQVADGHARWFIDGRQIFDASGRNYPVAQMAISFSLWFSPEGPLPKGGEPRVYEEDVDWVFHARGDVLSADQLNAQVKRFREAGIARVDAVPASGLDSRCDI
jgi:hypothetical protein